MQALIIMMSQNRQAEKDRIMEKKDYKVNKKAKQDIEEIQKAIENVGYPVLKAKVKAA